MLMEIIQQIVFAFVLGIVAWLVFRRIMVIKRTIELGRDEDRTDQPAVRFGNMLRIAFGQKKMFDKPIV